MPAPAADPVSRNALVFLATIAGGAMLFELRDILTPLALAVFLAMMIDGFARVLEARLPGLSRRFATPLAIVLSVLIFGGAAFFIADNGAAFAGQLVTYTPKLNGLIVRIAGLVGVEAPPSLNELVAKLNPASYLGRIAGGLQGFATTAIFVLVYLGFILASQQGWARKAIGLFPSRERRRDAVDAFLRIRNGIEQYLWVQTVTGLIIAGISWIAMTAVHLDNAIFWSILIFIACYIPILGGIVGVGAPSVFALVQFETLWQAIALIVVLQLTHAFVGNIILPRMQGRSLNMDPIVLLLGLTFWTTVWGLPGAFLSTPLMTITMVILAQFTGTHWIAVLLSGDGDPSALKGSPALHELPNAGPPKPSRKPRPKNLRPGT
ncbi:AI-2E family transporter [Phenylobacterium sp.]|uniref:AI-2E family transporter n=1 Tax=Phenylobacterium sp. TaxID=1871053 RepID=UPI0025D2DDAE|nr:AI-2E family transporter [Phenylobacterium sp.]